MQSITRLIFISLCTFLSFQIYGQQEGFEKLYNDYIDGFGSDIAEIPDGYLITGTKVNKEAGNTTVATFLRKINESGEVIFDRLIPVEANAKIYPQKETGKYTH